MKNLLKLRKDESDFQNFYRNGNENLYEHPIELEQLRSVIREGDPKYRGLMVKDFSEILSEDAYFQENQNISVFQHLRYLPPIRHKHDFYEIACVLSGSCTNYIAEQPMTLSPGDILIIAPQTWHAICTCLDEGVIINLLIRSSTFESQFLNLLPHSDILYKFFAATLRHSSRMPFLIFHTGDDQALKDEIVEIHHEYTRNRRYKTTMINSQLSIFFVNLMRRHEQDVIIPNMKENVMNEETLFILQYMQENYTTISLSHLAEFFNYSERQIQRIIKDATGLNFNDNIKYIRMHHASDMLADTSLTVSEIAEALGYSDASSFRKVFKSFYNMTPQDYREARRQKNAKNLWPKE